MENIMKKFVLIPIILSLAICSDKNLADAKENYKVVVKPVLVLRDSPGLKGKKISDIPYAAKIEYLAESKNEATILGLTGEWKKIRWQDKTGWVFGPFIDKSDSKVSYVIRNGVAVNETEIKIHSDSQLEIYEDKSSGLAWLKCNMGQTIRNGNCSGEEKRNSSSGAGYQSIGHEYCAGIKVLNRSWHLPAASELKMLAKIQNFQKAFPDSSLGLYSSSSEGSSGEEDYRISVSIPAGKESGSMLYEGYVKCVGKSKSNH
jgi:hypothetical protein